MTIGLLQTGQGAVYYYDGSKLSTAASSLIAPTGIGYDAKRRILYVGSMIREVWNVLVNFQIYKTIWAFE